jgi:hypothetical protein
MAGAIHMVLQDWDYSNNRFNNKMSQPAGIIGVLHGREQVQQQNTPWPGYNNNGNWLNQLAGDIFVHRDRDASLNGLS